MSHDITLHDKQAFAGTGAWHGLGTVVPTDMDPETAIREYLGWTVDARECFFRNSKGEFQIVPDKRVTVRTDNDLPLGVVSDSYQVVQNVEMLEDIKALCGESGARVHTIGSLKGCRRVWVLLKMNNESLIAGDQFNEFLAMMTSHDGSGGYVIAPTAVRIVCNNTYSAAFGANEGRGHAITVRHTSGARDKLAQARDILGKTRTSFAQFRDTLTALGGNAITETAAQFILEHVVPGDSGIAKNRRAEILEMFKIPKGGLTPAVKRTALGLYNAVTEYVDYRMTVRGKGRDVAIARAEGSIIGSGANLRHDALSIIKEAMTNKQLATVMADDSAEPSLVEKLVAAATA